MTTSDARYSVTPEQHQVLWEREGAISLVYNYRGGDNHEWRDCAADIVAQLRQRWDVIEVAVPLFKPFEDFAELAYSIAGTKVTLHSDCCLDTIWLSCEDRQFLGQLMRFLGERVGWNQAS